MKILHRKRLEHLQVLVTAGVGKQIPTDTEEAAVHNNLFGRKKINKS
jgi:hypothetical protein